MDASNEIPAAASDFDPLAAFSAAAEPPEAKKKTKAEVREEEKAFKKVAENALKPSKEEIQRHQHLASRLRRCFENKIFGEEIKSAGLHMTSKEMKEATAEELEEQLTRIFTVLDGMGSADCIKGIALTGLSILEGAAVRFPVVRQRINIAGLTAELEKNHEFACILAQMELQYDIGSRISVEKRMVFTIWQAALGVHARNALVAKLATASAGAQAELAMAAAAKIAAAAAAAAPEQKSAVDEPQAPVFPADLFSSINRAAQASELD